MPTMIRYAAGWLVRSPCYAVLLGAVCAGCALHPKGTCGPSCPTIESASHIIEYPSQRLVILNRLAVRTDLSPHEQIYLVNAIAMGGFSAKVADAYVALIRNPCCIEATCDHIRTKLKLTRMLGRDQRRIIEALEARARDGPASAGKPPRNEAGS